MEYLDYGTTLAFQRLYATLSTYIIAYNWNYIIYSLCILSYLLSQSDGKISSNFQSTLLLKSILLSATLNSVLSLSCNNLFNAYTLENKSEFERSSPLSILSSRTIEDVLPIKILWWQHIFLKFLIASNHVTYCSTSYRRLPETEAVLCLMTTATWK